jgi:hypothetical protein
MRKHIFIELRKSFASTMKIRKIRCIPIEIDTETGLILVVEGNKNSQYSVHGTRISEDFEEFLSVEVFAILYDEKIAKMQAVPKLQPTPTPTPTPQPAQSQTEE